MDAAKACNHVRLFGGGTNDLVHRSEIVISFVNGTIFLRLGVLYGICGSYGSYCSYCWFLMFVIGANFNADANCQRMAFLRCSCLGNGGGRSRVLQIL